MAKLSITDYVHRGNGITVSFSDGDVCDITYEFDAELQRMVRNGCDDAQKLFLIQELLDDEPVDELGAVDARFIDRRPEYRSDSFSLLGSVTVVRNIRFSRIVQISFLDPPLGPFLPPVGTIDPGNTSSTDAALINNNLTDLCYNNLLVGSAGRESVAVDLGGGGPYNLRFIGVYWWNATHIANTFTVETSLDGLTWSSFGNFTGAFLGTAVPQLVDIGVTVPARYARLRCVTGADVNYMVISELRCYSAGTAPSNKLFDFTDIGIDVIDAGNEQTIFKNLRSIKRDLIVQYLIG